MIFLNPAVLFGLLAASIPVLIHLLNLRKLKRVDFSTLAFLKELQKNKIRKIKLKQWLLMALRVLIILFLVTAFARPTLKGVAIGGTTSAAKTSAVFILDDTFSMSVIDQNGSYFNQEKETIKNLLNQLQEGDDAALVLVSDNGKSNPKLTSNLSDFEKQIDKTEISDKSGLLNNSIVKAGEILSKSDNFNKEIYLLSDFQSGRLANENDITDLSKLLNDKIRLYTFNYSGKDVYNIGISNLTVESQIFEKNKPVDFNVTVTNYSNQIVKNLVVSLFVNGKRNVQQSINLNPGESKTTSFEAVINSKGFADVFAEIEDDDINQDNKRYTNVFIPGEIPVIIFTDNPDDSKFVKLALSADESNSIKVTERNLNQISSINLNDFDAVFVIGSQNISNVDRLKSYLNSGGGLFLMPGSNSNANQFGNLLSQLSLPKPQGEVNETNQNGNPVSFSKIEYDHPIFNDLFLKKDEKKKIESPDIYRYLKINTEGKGKNIISLVDGSSFLSEFKINSGKVFLLSVSPVLSWSNFPLKSIFVPIINKSVYYFSSKDRGQVNYIAGDEVTVNISNRTNPQIKIVQPNKTEVFINLEKNSVNNYLNYNQTSFTGNYDVYSGNNILTEFAVNTDPLESVTKYLNEKEFSDYLKKINFKGIHITIKKDENPAQIISQARFGSELWKYFVLIALILALIEMTIARNAKKELVEVSSK